MQLGTRILRIGENIIYYSFIYGSEHGEGKLYKDTYSMKAGISLVFCPLSQPFKIQFITIHTGFLMT